MIPLHTLYTPSHEPLFKQYFAPSVPADMELRMHFLENEGSGTFKQPDWHRAIIRKVEVIIEAIHEHWGGVFVWSDVDVQFFGPFSEWVTRTTRRHDLVFQVDAPGPGLCDGFFFCRANATTLAIWEDVLEFVRKPESKGDDQWRVQQLAAARTDTCIGYLPPLFMGGGTFTGQAWHPGQPVLLTRGLLMHHANFTIGVPNKLALCQAAREQWKQGATIPLDEACRRLGDPAQFQYDGEGSDLTH